MIYDNASLVQIPSGYKAGTLYSVLPANGDGDFDFTRASIATRVNSQGLIETVASGVPRLDYPILNGVVQSCPALLLEPARTNVVTYSEAIDNAAWTKANAPTITANIAIAPDGIMSADGIQDTTGGNFKRISKSVSVSANSTNTASVFVKKETTQTNFGGIALSYSGGTSKYAYGIINPIDGTIVVSSDSAIGATSTKVEDYGDWWRLSLTATDNGSNTTLEIAYYATLSSNGTSTGVGAGSVRTVWGFQLEIGATYATSYIPTSGTTITRAAEVCNGAGTSAEFNDSEGVLFAEISALANDLTQRALGISDGTSSNRMSIVYNDATSNALRMFVTNPSGTTSYIDYSHTITENNKVSIKWNGTALAFWINGFQITTASLNAAFGVNVLNTIQFSFNGTGTPFYGKTKQLIAFDAALTDEQLEDLTSWDSFEELAASQGYLLY